MGCAWQERITHGTGVGKRHVFEGHAPQGIVGAVEVGEHPGGQLPKSHQPVAFPQVPETTRVFRRILPPVPF